LPELRGDQAAAHLRVARVAVRERIEVSLRGGGPVGVEQQPSALELGRELLSRDLRQLAQRRLGVGVVPLLDGGPVDTHPRLA